MLSRGGLATKKNSAILNDVLMDQILSGARQYLESESSMMTEWTSQAYLGQDDETLFQIKITIEVADVGKSDD